MVISWFLASLITGLVAKHLFYRSFFAWFLISILISPIFSLILLILFGQNAKKCPNCGEMIRLDARVCRYCRSEVN